MSNMYTCIVYLIEIRKLCSKNLVHEGVNFVAVLYCGYKKLSYIAEGPRDASCQLKYCQLPRNSAETTYTTSPDQIDGMKLEI